MGLSLRLVYGSKVSVDVVDDPVAGVMGVCGTHGCLEVFCGKFDELSVGGVENVEAITKVNNFHFYSFHVKVRTRFRPNTYIANRRNTPVVSA